MLSFNNKLKKPMSMFHNTEASSLAYAHLFLKYNFTKIEKVLLAATSLRRKNFAEALTELVNHPLGDVSCGQELNKVRGDFLAKSFVIFKSAWVWHLFVNKDCHY